MNNRFAIAVAAVLSLVPFTSRAQSAFSLTKKVGGDVAAVAGDAAKRKAEDKVNSRLLAESRNNQCSFKSGTAVLAPGCDAKAKRLAASLVDAKRTLDGAGVRNFKFVVSGHTDTSGSAAANKELSAKRAAVMVAELVKHGIDRSEIVSVGMGSEKPLVSPDDTPAKKAKNRRYELQIKI